jgi:hypothetical protein
MGVDCKFLNFRVNIAKSLKLHGLKVNFSLKKIKGWLATPLGVAGPPQLVGGVAEATPWPLGVAGGGHPQWPNLKKKKKLKK